MGNRQRKRLIVLVVFVILATILVAIWSTGSASADGPGTQPAPTDPYFREEAPGRMVECANNVFVPLGEGGTWECPPPGEAPGDIVGTLVDCPDGTVGRIINSDLENTCEEVPGEYATISAKTPPGQSSSTVPEFSPVQYGFIVVGLLAMAGGALYMIYGKRFE